MVTGTTVIITEKPSVAQEYRKVLKVSGEKQKGYCEGFSPVLNTNTVITWAVGHLVGIAPTEKQNADWGGAWSASILPMIPQEWKYEPLEDSKDQYNVVRSIYTRKDVDRIYYAGDSGREGIYIQALIRNQIFKAAAPKGITELVVWIDSFTEESILNGIKTAKPYSTYQPMIDAGYERARADWLIGMNFTRAFTITSGQLINTGRVMTPTLAMVVRRQAEIDNFQKTYYFGLAADCADCQPTWKAVKGSRFFESDLLYNETGFLKKEDAEKLLQTLNQDKSLTVAEVKTQTKTEYAPLLFNLADLQAYCSKNFKISPAKTLEIAQKLYEPECKLTTYPRTDSRYLSTAQAKELKSMGYAVPSRYVDDAKVTDHFAIIPTFAGAKKPSELEGTMRQVYEAILKRFMDTMKPPFIYDTVSTAYRHSSGEPFFDSFRIVKQMGFREGENVESSTRPIPQKGMTVPVKQFSIRNLETKPPVPYTTGTLIMAMEKAGKLIEDEELREQIKTSGIGTSATRAAIIEKLSKKFITIDEKSQKVAPTDFGKAVIPIIAKFDEALVSPVKTADMEAQLEQIAQSNLSADEYAVSLNEYVTNTTKHILAAQKQTFAGSGSGQQGETYKCPHCGGDVSKGKFGWYCHSKCGASFQKVYGHELTDKQIISLLNGKETSFTANGKKTIVLPELIENPYNGKTYWNWKTKRG